MKPVVETAGLPAAGTHAFTSEDSSGVTMEGRLGACAAASGLRSTGRGAGGSIEGGGGH